MTWQSVTLETREPHDLFLVAATTAVTGLEIAVQLNEIPAYLRELDRRELVILAPARFLAHAKLRSGVRSSSVILRLLKRGMSQLAASERTRRRFPLSASVDGFG